MTGQPPSTADRRPLRIALLSYRGDPFCGGQGVYVRHLSRELARLGHHVEVIGAQPYPVLDEVEGPGSVRLVELPSLDLYRADDPFRTPALAELRGAVDALEVATMWTGGFPEPLTFSLRARQFLARHRGRYDVVHDNQTLGYGLLGLARHGFPLVTTIHHPVTVDRRLELEAADTRLRRLSLRRWYSFTRMQRRVTARLEQIITVSGSSKAEIVRHLGAAPGSVSVVPIGADTRLWSPSAEVPVVPGRIVATSSADVPLKGLVHLIEALAKVRTERDAHLVVVCKKQGEGPVADAVRRFGLEPHIEFRTGLTDQELVDLYRSAEVACVPSLYEGFSLPAAEAMATGTPLVATTGGAIPEVAGPDGQTCLAVPPGDAGALAGALGRLLDDAELRARLGAAGRERVLAHFTWERAAELTVERYRAAVASGVGQRARSGAGWRYVA
ncbi:glycosyltransferase family 4 protein [Kitasatospora sp. NBC_01266]|uniref:glycosyltransferase family 4 protein n=1 Tax=Kitasatospora sp. NBC_01266 TaxID=2903572 RepID=UPI002E357AD6|nr:glycosyltransferase family 4 protein [Kitasatospora sp. NBC_01266]